MVGNLLHMLLNDEVNITDLKMNKKAIEYSIDHRQTWKSLPCNEFIDFVLSSQTIGTTDGGTIDLSKIVTQEQLAAALAGYAKNTAIANFITQTDLTTILGDYIKSVDVDTRITTLTANFVTTTQVQNLIAAAGHLTAADIANFLTEAQIDAKIAAAIALITPGSGEGTGTDGLNQAQVQALINAAGHLVAADIADFLTETQIDAKIAAGGFLTAADIANFLTSSQIDSKIATAIAGSGHLTSADLVNYATQSDIANFVTGSQVDAKIAAAGHLTSADIANFVTGSDVDTKIANAGHLTSADIANFLTETQIDAKIAAAGTGSGITEAQVDAKIAAAGHLTSADLAGYAKTTDIANFVTGSDVDTKIANAGHLTSTDIADFLTETQIDTKISTALSGSTLGMTEQQIKDYIDNETSSFITGTEADSKISAALAAYTPTGGISSDEVDQRIQDAIDNLDFVSAELSAPLAFNLYKMDGTAVPQSFAKGDSIESVLRSIVTNNQIMVYDPNVKIPASMIDNSGTTPGGGDEPAASDADKYRYYGPIGIDVPINENTIVNLPNKLSDISTMELDWGPVVLEEESMCYAYPASLGDAASIMDGNNFNYANSFSKYTVQVNGVPFTVYAQANDELNVSELEESDNFSIHFK